jgi:hypothetical protein
MLSRLLEASLLLASPPGTAGPEDPIEPAIVPAAELGSDEAPASTDAEPAPTQPPAPTVTTPAPDATPPSSTPTPTTTQSRPTAITPIPSTTTVGPDPLDPSAGSQPTETPKLLRALRLGEDSLILGGYIQPGFIWVSDTDFNENDQDGFDFANARLTGRGRKDIIKNQLSVGFNFNFDVNRGNFTVRDTFGSIDWRDGLIGFDIGQLKQPFGLALLQYESMLQMPMSSRIRTLAWGRDLGAQLRAEGAAGRVWMKGAFMVANGEGGFRQRRNLDDTFNYVGRFEIGPLGRMILSEPDLDHSPLRFVVGVNGGYTDKQGKGLGLGDVGAPEARVGGDVRIHFRGLSARAEYIHAWRGRNDPEAPFERYGVTAQIGYVLPIPIKLPRFEPTFRFQQFDLNMSQIGNEGADYIFDLTSTRVWEPGLAIYLLGHATKIVMSYQLTDLLEGPRVDVNGAPLFGDTFMIVVAFAWL